MVLPYVSVVVRNRRHFVSIVGKEGRVETCRGKCRDANLIYVEGVSIWARPRQYGYLINLMQLATLFDADETLQECGTVDGFRKVGDVMCVK